MRPGNTPGLSFTSSIRFASTVAGDDGYDRIGNRSPRRLSAVRSIDILSRVRVRAKLEKIGISCRDGLTAPRDRHEFPLMDDLKPFS
jgi:hypothetical protein